jgi:hypothetical protein
MTPTFRMVVRGGGLGLLKELGFFFFSGAQLAAEEFERHRALEFHVERAVNHSHAAGADDTKDLAFADAFSDG